ncbi:hypothetical protein EF847_21560 [Actinobacteria bacterium YIM 96077]|uniref:Uncharacterized protein n=1 Tax=Phytoactinopolyspora halophila TaxID=1981511 RepID=A0A329QTH8_9ACTN|nr:hypothetical protein EF847_21560 [Actinobacteria bacterium YIM 96077]RAW15341.1 hypothetical protein DPM12_08790 [Phytoactinopolyspora halophila]
MTAVMTAMVFTGCGSGDSTDDWSPQVEASPSDEAQPDSPQEPSDTDSSESESGGPEAEDQTFAECMRDHGIDMSDPDPQTGIPELDPSVDPDNPTVRDAMDECEHLMEGGGRAAPDDQDMAAYLEFAQCMRENGLPDFPDPQPGSDGVFGDADVDRSDPAFQQAAEACQHLLDESRE